MSKPLTKEVLKEMVAELVKELTNQNPKEHDEREIEFKRMREQLDAVERKHTAELVHQGMPSAYEKKAKHVISGDRYKGAGLKLGRFMRAVALANKSHVSPQSVAKEWGDPWLADAIDGAQQKALASGTMSAGGALVPEEFKMELIELLRSKAVVRAAGCPVLPMRNGSMTMPMQTAAATAAYVGENANISSSQITTAQLQLSAKKLAALTPVSNDLLRESDPSADAVVRDDLVKVMALREDYAFLLDDGTANKPKGIRYRTASGNVFAANATFNLANTTTELFKMMRLVKSNNVMIDKPAWFMSTRSAFAIRSLRDGNGNLVWEEQMSQGKLLGFPYFESNQIPDTGGGGTNESTIIFCEMSEAIIADAMTLEVESFSGGSYYDGSAVQSGISLDQTVIRAIAKHDFGMRHDKAASVLTTVLYI